MALFTNTTSNTRLDSVLAELTGHSRSKIAKAIENGYVKINCISTIKPSATIVHDDKIELDDKFFEQKSKPENANIPNILYTDDDIIVIDKPSGLVVHDGDGVKESTLVDYLKQNDYKLATVCGDGRDGIVHRLDVGTSGVMVVAKNNESALELKESIVHKETSKLYLAIIEQPLKEDAMIDKPISRNVKNRVAMKVNDDGKPSKTLFLKLLQSKNGKYEIIVAKIFTGRTHQIRAHLKHLSRCIIGDSLYGFKSQNDKLPPQRVLLHSYILNIKHPKNGKNLCFLAPLPEDFKDFLTKEFSEEKIDEVITEEYIYSRLDTFFGGVR